MARNKSIAVNEAERTLVAHARAVMRLREKRDRLTAEGEKIGEELAHAERRLAGLLVPGDSPAAGLKDQRLAFATEQPADTTEQLAGAAR